MAFPKFFVRVQEYSCEQKNALAIVRTNALEHELWAFARAAQNVAPSSQRKQNR